MAAAGAQPADVDKSLRRKKCPSCPHQAGTHEYDGYGSNKHGSWDWYRCNACECRVKLDIPGGTVNTDWAVPGAYPG
jgi:hypothetical protein